MKSFDIFSFLFLISISCSYAGNPETSLRTIISSGDLLRTVESYKSDTQAGRQENIKTCVAELTNHLKDTDELLSLEILKNKIIKAKNLPFYQEGNYYHYTNSDIVRDLFLNKKLSLAEQQNQIAKMIQFQKSLYDSFYNNSFFGLYLSSNPLSSRMYGSMQLKIKLDPNAESIVLQKGFPEPALKELNEKYPNLYLKCNTNQTAKTLLQQLILEDMGVGIVYYSEMEQWLVLLTPKIVKSSQFKASFRNKSENQYNLIVNDALKQSNENIYELINFNFKKISKGSITTIDWDSNLSNMISPIDVTDSELYEKLKKSIISFYRQEVYNSTQHVFLFEKIEAIRNDSVLSDADWLQIIKIYTTSSNRLDLYLSTDLLSTRNFCDYRDKNEKIAIHRLFSKSLILNFTLDQQIEWYKYFYHDMCTRTLSHRQIHS